MKTGHVCECKKVTYSRMKNPPPNRHFKCIAQCLSNWKYMKLYNNLTQLNAPSFQVLQIFTKTNKYASFHQ